MLITQGMYQENAPVIVPRSYQQAWYGCSVATYPITREYLPGPEDESGRKQIPNQQATIMEHQIIIISPLKTTAIVSIRSLIGRGQHFLISYLFDSL